MSDDRRPIRCLTPREPAFPRGQLRLFFGYAGGRGKDLCHAESAHRACKDGRDCIIGYIEPHADPKPSS